MLAFGEVASADELNWEKKVNSSGFRPQPLWKKKTGERELFHGELSEAEIKGVSGAMNLTVAAGHPWLVCGTTPDWTRQICVYVTSP